MADVDVVPVGVRRPHAAVGASVSITELAICGPLLVALSLAAGALGLASPRAVHLVPGAWSGLVNILRGALSGFTPLR